MKKNIVLFLLAFLTACSPASEGKNTTPTTPPPTPTSEAGMPPVEGPNPTTKVAAFYYPWYGTPEVDHDWIHWDEPSFQPPQDIASDFYPLLGAYSSRDPKIIAQHMAWLRQAGIGLIITSWWGPGSREDQAVPQLMDIADQYGIKVAFHIEPYSGRTAEKLVEDVKYIYKMYGDKPAFFYSDATSQYSADARPRGMFFVWNIENSEADHPVQAEYWLPAMDAIHALPQGGLIIADTTQTNWVDAAHFDGLYNYATLNLEQNGGFNWARSLPPNSLYIPSVIPGFSAKRIGYPSDTYVPRDDGATFNSQWTAALDTGMEPAMVTVTSFNEWHEGSMIEPAAPGANDGKGNTYSDFGTLPQDGYLKLTHDWIDKYLETQFPATYRARITITTTSDWTTLNALNGGAWMRPALVSASETSTNTGMESGDRFVLMQSLEDANAGKQVEMTWDVLLTGLDAGKDLVLQIDRGNIGTTQVTIYNYIGDTPVQVGTYDWSGVTTDRNSHLINIPAAELMQPAP